MAALALAATGAPAAGPRVDVTIPAGRYLLHGCYQLPDGSGPYPVVIFNHGSEKDPAPCGPPDLSDLYGQQGYAFFTFQRHGHGASPGEYIMDLQQQAFAAHRADPDVARGEAVALQELYASDVDSAVAWLRQQSWADTRRIAMTGISFGGIQTLLAAGKGPGIRAFLAFAPAAQSWNPVLAARLQRAVRAAQAPIFIIQARNDYSLEPSRVLGTELAMKGPPNQAKVYPAFGRTTQEGHWQFATSRAGIKLWSPEVIAWLDAQLRLPEPAAPVRAAP